MVDYERLLALQEDILVADNNNNNNTLFPHLEVTVDESFNPINPYLTIEDLFSWAIKAIFKHGASL